MTENLEKNVHRNITKNFYVDEEQNYFIQKDHDQEVQRLPGPTVTTINMAAERVSDNPSKRFIFCIINNALLSIDWENANAKDMFINQDVQKASSKVVTDDPTLFRQDVTYEKQPDIYIHRPTTPVIPLILSDNASVTSEMSGHDSESIYEAIRVFTPKIQSELSYTFFLNLKHLSL